MLCHFFLISHVEFHIFMEVVDAFFFHKLHSLRSQYDFYGQRPVHTVTQIAVMIQSILLSISFGSLCLYSLAKSPFAGC